MTTASAAGLSLDRKCLGDWRSLLRRTGDTSHTRWGWEHGVEPGSYTADQPTNLESLLLLKALVGRHPATDIRLGHQ